jgi:hypothetical protein
MRRAAKVWANPAMTPLKRLLSMRELHVFFTPQPLEVTWARSAAGPDEHVLALVVWLKCFGRLGVLPGAGWSSAPRRTSAPPPRPPPPCTGKTLRTSGRRQEEYSELSGGEEPFGIVECEYLC